MNPSLKLIIPPDEIKGAVKRVASELENDYAGKDPVLVGVLKGAFLFMSDLMRELKIPVEADFIQASCYGTREIPSSEVVITRDLTMDLKGRDIIIIEGIIDRGHTARALTRHLGDRDPASISICSLLVRKRAPEDALPKYTGFVIDEGFVVGYGMDYKEHYRGLPGLYMIIPD